eukprot:gene5236-5615_t
MWSLLGFKARYKKGQKIEATHPSGKFLPAVIKEVLDNGQYYSVEFEGEGIASKISGKFVREISTAPTVRTVEDSSRTINTESTHLPPPRSPTMSTRSPSTHMRKTASIGKLQKTMSTRSSMSDKDGEGKKIVTPTQSRKNTMTFNLRKPSLSLSTKGSTRSPGRNSTPTNAYVDYTKPQSPMMLSAEPLEVLAIPDLEDYVTPTTNNQPQKPPKEKKERGKEEILLLSRIRRCRDQDDRQYRSIDISRLNVERLPLLLLQINDLKELISRKNPLQSLDEIILFQQLERLDLSFTSNIIDVSGWPRVLSEIPTIKVLELNNMQLIEIPEEIRVLKRLEKLSLRNNQIKVLPDWLGELRYLHTLDVSGNQIDFLPPFLGQMKALTDLITQNNPCQSLDLMTPEVAFLVDKRSIFMDKEQRKSLTHRAVKVNATIIERQKNQLVQDYIEEI